MIEATVGNRSDIIVLKNEYNMVRQRREIGESARRGESILPFWMPMTGGERIKLARQLKLL